MPDSSSEEDLAAIVRRGRSRPVRKILVIALLVALAGAAAFYYLRRPKEAGSGTTYVTRPAEATDISIVVTASGNLAPTNQIVVGSELSGIVSEVYVDTNDPVEKGQALLKLDVSKLEQQTNRARASLLVSQARLRQAEATLDESRAALKRQEELLRLSGGKTPSQAVMETSRAAVARAEADVASAKAEISASEAEIGSFESDLGKSTIRSPVDGVVLARSIEVGQTVAASFTAPTLFTIAEDLRKMELVVAVSEADIGRVEAGQTATFDVDAYSGRSYAATVKKVALGSAASTAGDAAKANTSGVVTYDTELAVDNEDLSLRPGMTATVDIHVVNRRDVLAVPNSALRFDPQVYKALNTPDKKDETLVESLSMRRRWRRNGPRGGGSEGGPAVWVLRDGEPVRFAVETGVSDGSVTEITGGELQPGDEVITSIEPAKA